MVGPPDRVTCSPPSTVTDAGTGRHNRARVFTFPMEFRPHDGGWQLTGDTADMLLAFGNARTEAASPARRSPAHRAALDGPDVDRLA